MTKWMTTRPAGEPPPFRGNTPGWSSNKDGPLCRRAQNKTSHFEGRDTRSYLIVAGLCVMVHECVCMQPCNHSDQFQWRHRHPEAGMKQQSPLCALTLCKVYPDVGHSPRKSRLLSTRYCFTKVMILTPSHLWGNKTPNTFPDLLCITCACAKSYSPIWVPYSNPSTYLRKNFELST